MRVLGMRKSFVGIANLIELEAMGNQKLGVDLAGLQQRPSSCLLAFSRTPRRRVDRIAGSTRLFFRRPFDGLAEFAPVAMGHLFLMCRMLMIVRLEMFLLMLGTFAIFRHKLLLCPGYRLGITYLPLVAVMGTTPSGWSAMYSAAALAANS